MPRFPSDLEKLYLHYLSDLMMKKYSDPRWQAEQALKEQGTAGQRRIQSQKDMAQGADIQGSVRGLAPDVMDESGVRAYSLRSTDKLLKEFKDRMSRKAGKEI